MISSDIQKIGSKLEGLTETELLREENTHLHQVNREAFDYIRNKVNSLLEVVGTKSLRPEELDDHGLIEFDPIGIVAQSFLYILENLRETNQKLIFASNELQTVFETVGAAILVLDPHGRILSYNQRSRGLLFDADLDILGKSCRDHICHMDVDEDMCTFANVMRNRDEFCFKSWEFGGRSFDVVGRPMFDDQGNVTHVVMAYHDVSSRRQAENALLRALAETTEANAKIRGILRSAADGILITDAEDNLVLINRRAEELIGLPTLKPGEVLPIAMIPHAGLAELLLGMREQEPEIFATDLSFQRPGNLPCICKASITVISSAESGFSGCITLLHDVTEQRMIDRMKDEFVSTAAHELRTPLATIIGFADLLMMENDYSPEQQTEFLQHILKKAEHLGTIVSNLLDISRIESGGDVQFDIKPHRLENLCEEVVNSFRMQTSGHTFFMDFPKSPAVEVNVDHYAMMQILENLVSNAVKYSPGGGEIRFSCQRQNDIWMLSIRDQGIGMTGEQKTRVYDKFYRADASNTAIPGTGLGMTIVKHLVEAQSGQVEVASSPGKGTTVTISLPAAPRSTG